METALKIVKGVFRVIGWLLATALHALALVLGVLFAGQSGFSSNMMQQQSHEIEAWSRSNRQRETLYRR